MILFFNEKWEGYKFESLHADLGVLVSESYKNLERGADVDYVGHL